MDSVPSITLGTSPQRLGLASAPPHKASGGGSSAHLGPWPAGAASGCRTGQGAMPQLTHPHFTKLPGPQSPDQLEGLPGDFPFVLDPGVLRCQAHTGQGQPLA